MTKESKEAYFLEHSPMGPEQLYNEHDHHVAAMMGQSQATWKGHRWVSW